MTPEERAAAFVNGLDDIPSPQYLIADIAAAIREAVAEEREACAKLVEHWCGCVLTTDTGLRFYPDDYIRHMRTRTGATS